MPRTSKPDAPLVVRGTVIKLRRLCGKPNCRCADGRLHESWALSYSLEGRTRMADTKMGISGMRALARIGAPYAMVLYERFLGRPFAGHRDSVSELIGDGLENAIEEVLSQASISFRKTKRAEKLDGFDQSPDFIIPSEFNPQVIIEAKITEDDGTARDKVTRIQHLAELSRASKRRATCKTPRVSEQATVCGGGNKNNHYI